LFLVSGNASASRPIACLPKVGTGFGIRTCLKQGTKAQGANLKDRDALYLSRPPERMRRGLIHCARPCAAAIARPQFFLASGDVVAGNRHRVIAARELDLEHHQALPSKCSFRTRQVKIPHAEKALVVDFQHALALLMKALTP